MAAEAMERPGRRAPTPRSPLTRERILGAGVDLADAEGIAGLSMRRLAHELGVEAMSLYYHVARKSDLLDGMLDIVYGEMARPAADGNWRADMRAAAISAKDTLLRHEWACRLLMDRGTPGRLRFEWMDSILGRLRAAGFSPNLTHHAYHAIDSHVVGFVLWVLPYVAASREQPDLAENAMRDFPIGGLPHLVEHIQQHLDDRPGDTSEFEFGLDLLLDGLERLRLAASR